MSKLSGFAADPTVAVSVPSTRAWAPARGLARRKAPPNPSAKRSMATVSLRTDRIYVHSPGSDWSGRCGLVGGLVEAAHDLPEEVALRGLVVVEHAALVVALEGVVALDETW